MKCPEIDLLIDFGDDATSRLAVEPEVKEHLDTCPTCGDALRLVRSVRTAFQAESPVPVPDQVVVRAQEMVRRRAVARRDEAEARHRALRPVDLWCAGALGAAATLAAILATKPVHPAEAMIELALFALAGGATASWLQKQNWRQEVGATLATSPP